MMSPSLLLMLLLQSAPSAPMPWCDHMGQANCMVGATPYPPPPPPPPDIRRFMDESASAWSRGDLHGFMMSYDKHAIMLTTGGHLITPRDAIEAHYSRNYARGGASTMGKLTFDILGTGSVEGGPDTTIVYGRFHLKRPDGAESTGLFDLVMHHTPDGWRIVSDHTS